MKNILVTGAAGFIGSHVCQKLLERGSEVVGVDNLNNYYPVQYKQENIDLLKSYKNFSFKFCDITDTKQTAKLFSENSISHVAHLAARAGVRPSIADPLLYESTNVKGTLNLLEYAKQSDVENFVLTSSSSVYGNSKSVPFREDDNATDRPISPYAATKKSSEVLGHTYHHLYGLNINVVRPFTVYGPRGRPDMAPWLFLKAALTGGSIKKFGDGSTKRDYTFIGDFVSGFVNSIDRVFGWEIFNLGNSDTVSLNDAIQTVEEVSSKSLNIIQEGMQPGDVELTNAEISKAREKLEYNPQTSFKEGMKVFNDWFVDTRLPDFLGKEDKSQQVNL